MIKECTTLLQRRARQLFLDKVHSRDNYIYVERCPYCGHGLFTGISEIDRHGFPYDAAICDRCEGCFKRAVLKGKANAFYYENVSYLLRGHRTDRLAMEDAFNERVRRFARPRFHFIDNLTELTPGKDLIAEFGCNDGANLYPWIKAGFEVMGVDLDSKMADFGSKKGIKIVPGDMDVRLFEKEKPRLIILSHVLEHVSDINAALQTMRVCLAPDGYLFIEVPGIRVHGLVKPPGYFDIEHNYNFDLKSLRRVVKNNGLDLLYADEYARFICVHSNNAPVKPKSMPFSYDRIAASCLGSFPAVFGLGSRRLRDLLSAQGLDAVMIRAASRLQLLYYRHLYRSIENGRR
ncbi:MAG: class I SAM-dependent methyltransferase [Candidatus Omnitrophota bacterium]